jgi:hypothetical protein
MPTGTCRILKPTVGRGAELGGHSVTLDFARQVEPRWNPGTLKSGRGDWIRTGDPCAQAVNIAISGDFLQSPI